MASGYITVDVKLPTGVLHGIEAVAKLAGVSPATVIKVILAIEVAKRNAATPQPKP